MAKREQALPCNLDAERFVLGSILLNNARFTEVQGELSVSDFMLEKHRRIFRRMGEMHDLGETIDRVTLANELMRYGELESVDGISYLVSLDDGLPALENIASYTGIVKEKSILRQVIHRAQDLVNRALAGEEKAGPLLSEAVTQFQDLSCEMDVEETARRPGEVIAASGGVEKLLTPAQGVPTGYEKLDDLINGLCPGRVYVIGADTTVGKTTFAINVACRIVAEQKVGVLYHTLEMSGEEILHRILAAKAEVALIKIKRGYAGELEQHQLKVAAHEISDYPLYIDETSDATILDVYRNAERLVREHKIGVVMIDYLQILEWQGRGLPKFRDEREALVYTTKRLKRYARNLKIPIVVLSQLTRARKLRTSKDLRPKLSDLAGSSTVEKDSDVVMFIYRPEIDEPSRTEFKDRAELIVGKNRNGPQGTVHLRFQGHFTSFVEAEPPAEATE